MPGAKAAGYHLLPQMMLLMVADGLYLSNWLTTAKRTRLGITQSPLPALINEPLEPVNRIDPGGGGTSLTQARQLQELQRRRHFFWYFELNEDGRTPAQYDGQVGETFFSESPRVLNRYSSEAMHIRLRLFDKTTL